jgi:hypothetical protein
MTWDAALVSALGKELLHRLQGSKLRAHEFRWEERELVLYFRGGTLRWALHPGRGWVALDPAVEPSQGARPLSAELVDIHAPPDERHLEMRFRRSRGRVRLVRLVVELMTNQWNALLLEGEEGRIRHLLWTRNLEGRPLVVGRSYHPPEASSRHGIDPPLGLPEWQAILEKEGEGEVRRSLLEEVAFTSSINIPALISPRDPAEGHRLWQALRSMETPSPCVLEIGRDKQPYPYVIKSFDYTPFPDLLSAFQAVGGEGESGPSGWEEVEIELERALHRAERKVAGLLKEVREAADPEEPREKANLLLARLHEIPRGSSSVRLEGFTGEAVQLRLDPELTPQENAQELYAEAARRERARARLPALLEKAQGEKGRLERIREELREGNRSPQEVLDALPRKRRKVPGKREEERLPYRSFRSSGGMEIRVGRGSRDNDALTFKHAHPLDIWLHARDASGAHVVLRWGRKEPPPRRDLEEAAVLAALHSGSRGSSTVPVDWTRRKYVRKARKAPAGTVIPGEVQTLFVEPDRELLRRLKGDGPSPP